MSYNQDIQYALISFASTFHPYDSQPLKSIAQFSNGIVFAHLLSTVQQFPLALKDLQISSDKWIQKLTNLKIIVQRMQAYIKDTGKTLITKDIDLIEIAKHESSTHILRFFELVVAVFMQSPHKEDYIQTIMHLDQRSQHALVVIVQNAIGERMTDISQNNMNNKIIEQLTELNSENQLLREEIKQLTAAGLKYKRQLVQVKQRLEELEQIQQKYRHSKVQTMGASQIDQIKIMNDNLKQKLLQTARQNQEQISRARQQNIFLQNKMRQFKQYEQAIQNLKQQLADSQGDRQRFSEQERQKRRLNRIVQQKEATIRQLKQKLEETSEKNYNMQETELYMKMELQKKEVRFQQLQKQVKNRLKVQPFTTVSNPVLAQTSHTLDNEQIDYLQQQLQKLRVSYRELERQNLKLKKKVQKSQSLEGQKKKLEKIILDVSKSKDAELEMLLVSLYDLRTENIRIHQMLTKK